MNHPLAIGTRVRTQLPDVDQEHTGEVGTITSADDMREEWGVEGDGGFSYTMKVDPEYLDGAGDDGLREFYGEQIVEVIGHGSVDGAGVHEADYAFVQRTQERVAPLVRHQRAQRERAGWPWPQAH